ncbi:PAS domain-containing protein, partial [Escherichia coli]
MIFVTDAACHRIYASGEWTALTGQSIPDSLGRGWLDRVHADDRRIVMDALARAFSTASEFSIRFRVLR